MKRTVRTPSNGKGEAERTDKAAEVIRSYSFLQKSLTLPKVEPLTDTKK